MAVEVTNSAYIRKSVQTCTGCGHPAGWHRAVFSFADGRDPDMCCLGEGCDCSALHLEIWDVAASCDCLVCRHNRGEA